ncbi:CHRD domain-containing protein [filamentous cyanobacterium CCP1]|nr:CHRD domain-containing protein [filamentous cyanobacterium CCP2]PSB63109.1 CHRD domain-containing protein [filamentous cyanobacterium CCP1]
MNKPKRILFNLFLGTVTCILLIGGSNFSLNHNAFASILNLPTSQVSLAPTQDLPASNLVASLHEAESALMAQGASGQAVTRYVAVLKRSDVVPTTPSTSAFGAAGAVLMGDRLVIRGDYSNLTSALRDYATDPLDPPNPNITSGIHVHMGEPTENGPFQYALTVMPNASERAGRFSGEYTLTTEQLQALSMGKLYVDIHTTRNRGGELRGIFQAY